MNMDYEVQVANRAEAGSWSIGKSAQGRQDRDERGATTRSKQATLVGDIIWWAAG